MGAEISFLGNSTASTAPIASRLLGPSNPVRIRTQCPQNHHNSLALSLRAVTTKQEHQKQQQLLQSQQQQQQQQGKEE